MESYAPHSNVQHRVTGVLNSLVQKAFLKYLALFVLVGLGTFLVLHYHTDLLKDEDGQKKTLHQAAVAAGVALLASAGVLFARIM